MRSEEGRVRLELHHRRRPVHRGHPNAVMLSLRIQTVTFSHTLTPGVEAMQSCKGIMEIELCLDRLKSISSVFALNFYCFEYLEV